jgi:hypothetical protein
MNNYQKSNEIVSVEYSRFSSKEYNTLLLDKTDRAKSGQALLNYLCDKYKISRIPLVVSNSNRKCNKNGQTYGFYRFANGKGISIVIYNKTAKTGQIIAIKAFINTLLHEFIHHYDTEYLKIQSIHSAGFYKRITDLQTKLTK